MRLNDQVAGDEILLVLLEISTTRFYWKQLVAQKEHPKNSPNRGRITGSMLLSRTMVVLFRCTGLPLNERSCVKYQGVDDGAHCENPALG